MPSPAASIGVPRGAAQIDARMQLARVEDGVDAVAESGFEASATLHAGRRFQEPLAGLAIRVEELDRAITCAEPEQFACCAAELQRNIKQFLAALCIFLGLQQLDQVARAKCASSKIAASSTANIATMRDVIASGMWCLRAVSQMERCRRSAGC